MPKTLAAMPDLPAELAPTWEAYQVLSPGRASGGAIPLSEVAAYLEIAGITEPEARRRLMCRVRAMDREHIAWRNRQRKAEERRRPTRPGRSRGR